MQKSNLVLAAVLCAASLDATAYLVTVRTNSSAKTDVLPIQSNQDWFIDQTTPTFSVNPVTVQNNDAYAHGYTVAGANGGSIAVYGRANIFGEFDSTGGVGPADAVEAGAGAQVTLTIDDLVFTGPGNSTEVEINVDVSGFFAGEPQAHNPGVFARNTSSVIVAMNWNGGGTEFSGGQFRVGEHYDYPLPPVFTETANGDLTNVVFPDRLSLGPYTVSLDTAYSLELYMSVSATARLLGRGSGQVTSIADFGSTMSLPTSGPVFTLPDAYLASSASAGIVDNVWTGTPVSINPVPLPGALLLILGALPLALRARGARILQRPSWFSMSRYRTSALVGKPSAWGPSPAP